MTQIALYPDMFRSTERAVLTAGDFEAWAFRYSTGVAGLRISNSAGEMVVLPFQGQQIWDLRMFGRRQTMRSMFQEPRPNVPFLETYGGFLIHCGFSAMGGPGPTDSHPLHGELPNLTYDSASLILDEDEHGSYLAVRGSVEFARAFGPHYRAEPELRMYPRSGALRVRFTATNLNRSPMEYMYLCHVNFRPVDHGELVDTTPIDPEHVRVRANIPAHLPVTEEYRAFLSDLQDHPEKHITLAPNLPFDPEAVLFLDMGTDDSGTAHSLHRHPSGDGDFIAYKPAELDHAVRWICRTADQDGLGLVLPATAEPDGYTAEKQKGNVKTLTAGASFSCDFFTGALSIPATARYRTHIQEVRERGAGQIDPVALDAKSH